MTDNRTTELLREGLTKHGIEWRSGLEGVTFVGDWCFVEYDNGKLAATCEPALTPGQAVAATLGNGMLTAEQVQKHVQAIYFDGYSDGSEHRGHGIEEIDWRTIADELNAELGSGTCELEVNGDMTAVRCSKCGWKVPKKANLVNINFCQNCGRKVQ